MVVKKIKHSDEHEFAFYIHDLRANLHTTIVLSEPEIVHRLFRVLRLQVGDVCVLFNKTQHVRAQVKAIDKKQVIFFILDIQPNITFQPTIMYLLPLLKKDALHDAVYSLAEMGITKIQLVITEKSRQSLFDKEFVKLEKTIIAAGEQSKNYAIPELCYAKKLSDVLQELPLSRQKVVFDIDGLSYFDLKKNTDRNEPIVLLVGPEGGLIQEELELVKKWQFISCVLTPTILRAVQAVALTAGIFRLK